MASSTRLSFRRTILLSGMLEEGELRAELERLRREKDANGKRHKHISDAMLAESLIEKGVLTSYQADQLMAGRTKLTLGPYLITDWIGQGGMGQVFKAEHQVMGRECAVKVLPKEKSTPEAIDSFTREIRTQAQLDHPNLVRAFDAGHDGNVHYLVTEYVPGTDLRRLIHNQGPLTMQQAARVIMQAGMGLEYAHACGLIHRDVKPGNILVTPEGLSKVSDLGLSGYTHTKADDPRAGKIVGTADYLSPEQIRDPYEITKASDIYSLGCTLYYAVTGKVPFPGGSAKDKARRHLEESPWHPRRFNADLNEEFIDIIADMMEKEPAQRVQCCGDVAARLEPWVGDASRIPSRLTKSPWTPPPLLTEEETDETVVGSHDGFGVELEELPESSSQWSQGTDAIAGSSHDTSQSEEPATPPPLTDSVPRLTELRHRRSVVRAIAITLAIAIPVSLIAGYALGMLVGISVR